MAIEEPGYHVTKAEGPFELRQYVSYAIAETQVQGSFKAAGNEAFRKLLRYIQGQNSFEKSISMTAPVAMQDASSGTPIAMTAPVSESHGDSGYRVSFTLPQTLTAGSAPTPNDKSITLRQIPARSVAVLRYSGSWSESRYQEKKAELLRWLTAQGFRPKGEPVLARFNSPFTLWFLRRNEVQIDVE